MQCAEGVGNVSRAHLCGVLMSTPTYAASLSGWRGDPYASLALGSSLARWTKRMRSMTCGIVDRKFAAHTKGTQTQQVAVKRVKATRDPKTVTVCSV